MLNVECNQLLAVKKAIMYLFYKEMRYLNAISNLCARNVKNVQIYLYYRPSHLVRACPMIAKQLTQVWHDLGLVMVRPES